MATKKKTAPASTKPKPKAQTPPCPVGHESLGDKDPAVIAWYHDHDPDGFQQKYGRPPVETAVAGYRTPLHQLDPDESETKITTTPTEIQLD